MLGFSPLAANPLAASSVGAPGEEPSGVVSATGTSTGTALAAGVSLVIRSSTGVAAGSSACVSLVPTLLESRGTSYAQSLATGTSNGLYGYSRGQSFAIAYNPYRASKGTARAGALARAFNPYRLAVGKSKGTSSAQATTPYRLGRGVSSGDSTAFARSYATGRGVSLGGSAANGTPSQCGRGVSVASSLAAAFAAYRLASGTSAGESSATAYSNITSEAAQERARMNAVFVSRRDETLYVR